MAASTVMRTDKLPLKLPIPLADANDAGERRIDALTLVFRGGQAFVELLGGSGGRLDPLAAAFRQS